MELCVYTVDTIGAYAQLWTKTRTWSKHNKYSFFVFDNLNSTIYHNSWEKVSRAHELLENKACKMLMWIDADAVINNPHFQIERILNLYRFASIIGNCNSPTGNGLQCDASCCHVEKKKQCLDTHDIGNFSPYPCLMNSGVFFIRNNIKAKRIVSEWLRRKK